MRKIFISEKLTEISIRRLIISSSPWCNKTGLFVIHRCYRWSVTAEFYLQCRASCKTNIPIHSLTLKERKYFLALKHLCYISLLKEIQDGSNISTYSSYIMGRTCYGTQSARNKTALGCNELGSRTGKSHLHCGESTWCCGSEPNTHSVTEHCHSQVSLVWQVLSGKPKRYILHSSAAQAREQSAIFLHHKYKLQIC